MAKFVGVPDVLIAALERAGIIADRNKTRSVTIVLHASEVATVTVEMLGDDGELATIVRLLKVDDSDG